MSEQTFRVYSAEQSLPGGPRYSRISDIDSYVRSCRRSELWRTHFGNAGVLKVRRLDESDPDVLAYALRQGYGMESPHLLRFGRDTNDMVVLHELAHVISPRFTDGNSWIPKPIGSHSRYFTAALCWLVEEYFPSVRVGELRSAYEHFEVDVATFGELLQALKSETEVLSPLKSMLDEPNQQPVSPDSRTSESSGSELGTLMDPSWGEWIELLIRHSYNPATGRRWSRKAISNRVSAVIPCSEQDIKALIEAAEPPSDRSLLDVGTAIVALFGHDHIWAATGLGLDWSRLSRNSLAELNPPWAERVSQLEALLTDRPPLWESSLSR